MHDSEIIASIGGTSDAPERVRRFWLLYSAAWLPYAALTILIFVVSGVSWSQALVGAAAETLPAALAGLGVIRMTRWLRWPRRVRLGFVLLHLGLALLFGLATTLMGALVYSVDRWLRERIFAPQVADPSIWGWEIFMAMLLYGVIVAVAYVAQVVARLREEQERAARARLLQSQAEMAALRAKMNPHFLFNTLHTLLSLVRRDVARAEDALQQFGDLMRYVLQVQDESREEVPLADEWAFVRCFLDLEGLRLGDRLTVREKMDDEALGMLVPPLCLQPLVENAIRHGIAPRVGGGTLAVAADVRDGRLVVTVDDDGPGDDPAALEEGGGLGLSLARRRLQAIHGDAAGLEVRTAPGEGFRVTVSLPARRGEDRAAGDAPAGEGRPWRGAL